MRIMLKIEIGFFNRIFSDMVSMVFIIGIIMIIGIIGIIKISRDNGIGIQIERI
jgi:hypothetical protein